MSSKPYNSTESLVLSAALQGLGFSEIGRSLAGRTAQERRDQITEILGQSEIQDVTKLEENVRQVYLAHKTRLLLRQAIADAAKGEDLSAQDLARLASRQLGYPVTTKMVSATLRHMKGGKQQIAEPEPAHLQYANQLMNLIKKGEMTRDELYAWLVQKTGQKYQPSFFDAYLAKLQERIERQKPTVKAWTAAGASCSWPFGTPGTKGFHFCDRQAKPGKPYCQEHSRLAYAKTPQTK